MLGGEEKAAIDDMVFPVFVVISAHAVPSAGGQQSSVHIRWTAAAPLNGRS
jgi:hypothetical protein